MHDLKRCSLDQLAILAQRARLIDTCTPTDAGIVLQMGDLRVVLNEMRAHAFLRGVLRSALPIDPLHEVVLHGTATPTAARTSRPARPKALVAQQLADTFRDLDLLADHWKSYKRAGCPFGYAHIGLILWIRYETQVTVN